MGDDDDLPFRDDAEPAERRQGEDAVRSEGEAERDRGGDHHDREPPEHDKRRLFERVMPEILKRVVERAVESGASRLAEGPENLRQFVQDIKLPKEALHYLYQQIDDTKNGLYRVVAKEIRDVLDQTQFADEITKVLTKLSFEIKTEIRFIPNDAGVRRSDAPEEEGDGAGRKFPKPEVTSQVSIKDRGRRPFSARPPPNTSPKGGAGRDGAHSHPPDAAPPPTPGRRREDT